MAFCTDKGFENLVGELERAKGQNVLLYTVDGFAYYGQIRKIIEHKIVLVVPGTNQTAVIIRLPDQTFSPQGTSILRENYTYLDVARIAANTAHLSQIPTGWIVG